MSCVYFLWYYQIWLGCAVRSDSLSAPIEFSCQVTQVRSSDMGKRTTNMQRRCWPKEDCDIQRQCTVKWTSKKSMICGARCVTGLPWGTLFGVSGSYPTKYLLCYLTRIGPMVVNMHFPNFVITIHCIYGADLSVRCIFVTEYLTVGDFMLP